MGEYVQTDAADDVLNERARQVEREGWTPEHDDRHDHDDLAVAAACYAAHGTWAKVVGYTTGVDAWPWDPGSDKRKKHDRRRRLVIAAALILAEIERIDREVTP